MLFMQHTECFLSFYPDIYIIFLQHLYIENLNPHNILKLLTIPSLSAKGERLGERAYWVYWTVFMASL